MTGSGSSAVDQRMNKAFGSGSGSLSKVVDAAPPTGVEVESVIQKVQLPHPLPVDL